MNRLFTAAAAVAATLSLATLAQAQSAPGQTYDAGQHYETPGKPSAGWQAAPSVATSPALPSPSDPYTRSSMPAAPAQPPQTRPANQ
jgi:hypothetical protein